MVVTWIIMFSFFVFVYSRVAQMYREKLATLAARALQQYGLQVQCYSTSFHLNVLLGCSVLLGVLCVFMCMSVWHNLQFSRDGLPFASHLLNTLYPYMVQLTGRGLFSIMSWMLGIAHCISSPISRVIFLLFDKEIWEIFHEERGSAYSRRVWD